MKTNSILDARKREPEVSENVPAPGLLKFPGEDDGRSLTHMAQRDLDAALQLLAQRAQYITAASGTAIALREEREMICRASAGSSAPPLGSHLQVDSGLSGESVRSRQILRCDNAETDSRVNRDTCKALGIASVIVMPLIDNDEVVGVFELFSEREAAFEERDVVALQRLAEMILTAVEHAAAAKRTEQELRTAPAVQVEAQADVQVPAQQASVELPAPEKPVSEPAPANPELKKDLPTADKPAASPFDEEEDEPLFAKVNIEPGKIGKCESCGFPVSEGRALCLDCETAKSGGGPGAEFLTHFGESDQGWFSSHKYLIISAILFVILLVSLVLRFR